MATAYSSLLGMALPVTGELSGTWGDTVNNFITSYVDSAVAGANALTTDANVTLTKTTNAALGATSSQYAILLCTGARTVVRTITAPAASKTYVVINNTTGGFGVKIVGAGPTTGVTVPFGAAALVVWNGSDFEVINALGPNPVLTSIFETATVTAAAPTATTQFDLVTQAVQYYTSANTTNFTLNIRGNSTTTLNNTMAIGQSASIALLVTNTASAFYPSAFTIDGVSVTPKWQGGSAITAGNINAVDLYSVTVIKTAASTYTVLAAQTKFA